jgi:hypothetical protein
MLLKVTEAHSVVTNFNNRKSQNFQLNFHLGPKQVHTTLRVTEMRSVIQCTNKVVYRDHYQC